MRLAPLAFMVGQAYSVGCDSDSCPGSVGDETSAMQLHKQGAKMEKKSKKEPYWELIKSADVATELVYKNVSRGNPSCLQGIVFMDQTCVSYPDLPEKDRKLCSGDIGWLNEYTTTFGPWNKRTKCVQFERKTWTFGSKGDASTICKGNPPTFCQTNSRSHGPCDVGAHFKVRFGDLAFEVTTFGFDRITGPFHYPLLPIVDGQGQKTSWFPTYQGVTNRTSCPTSQTASLWTSCPNSQWAAEGEIARCVRPAPWWRL